MTAPFDGMSGKRVVLCAGPGGVGKTTSSAAVALAAARAGRNVLVLTIDPARRLADAMGTQLDAEPKPIPPDHLQRVGANAGELWAAMLDPRQTLDDLVTRLAPDAQSAAGLQRNSIYQQIVGALSGTVEYAAVEKLADLRERYNFDLIVVDTPPSQNVLDFLEAPQWLARFFDERIFGWLTPDAEPGRGLARRFMRRTSRIVWDVLARVLSEDFAEEVADFFGTVASMAPEIRRRADEIGALLRSEETLGLIVANTQSPVVREAVALRRAMEQRGIEFGGFIVNRTEPQTGVPDVDVALSELQDHLPQHLWADGIADKLRQVAHRTEAEARRDREAIEHLRRQANWSGFLAALPRYVGEVSDMVTLGHLADKLRHPLTHL